MPHHRKRYLENNLNITLNYSPIIGILGHRQVGKTTLLESICNQYISLDSKIILKSAKQDPEGFITKLKEKSKGLVGIDECQIEPGLFPALKEHVRKNKTPGQFLLSGSVRFTSRQAIRESLTGRILNFELLPFTIDELGHRPLKNSCHEALCSSSLERFFKRPKTTLSALQLYVKEMNAYFELGGLPGICFVKDMRIRKIKLEEQLRTLLDRDLRLVQKTTLALQDIRSLCVFLANTQGEPIDYSQLQKEIGISFPTLKKLFFALEAIFLIRSIPIEGGRKGHVVFFEDQGEANWLRFDPPSAEDNLKHFCFTNIRAQFEYRLGQKTETFHYRTRGGALIPFAFRNKEGVLGVIPLGDTSKLEKALGSANSFLKTYLNSKVLILHTGQDRRLFQSRLLLAPVAEFV